MGSWGETWAGWWCAPSYVCGGACTSGCCGCGAAGTREEVVACGGGRWKLPVSDMEGGWAVPDCSEAAEGPAGAGADRDGVTSGVGKGPVLRRGSAGTEPVPGQTDAEFSLCP